MSKKKKIALIVCAAILVLLALIAIPCLLRARANDALAKELHAEFDAWLASLPQVPDSENGALVILEGLELLEELPQYPDYPEVWTIEREKDARILREYLAGNEKALDLIEDGLEFQRWQYPVDYGKGWGADLRHEQKLVNAARVFVLKGEFRELEGKNAEAISCHIRTLRLGSTLSSTWFLVSCVMEVVIYRIALTKLVTISSKETLEEEHLVLVGEKLRELYGQRGDVIATINADALIQIKFIAAGIEEGYSMLRTWERLFDKETDEEKGHGFPPGKWWYDLESDVAACREFLEMCRNVHPARYYAMPEEFKNIGLLRKKFASTLTKSKGGEMINYPTLSDRVIPLSAWNLRRFAADEAFWRASIAVAAIKLFEKRNGRLPKNLDELGALVPKELLIDPFSGKHLVYRLKGEGDFCLYSVGRDGVDGKCEDTRELFDVQQREGEPDDIIFHAPRKKAKDE